ncbi:MAG: histidine triad nucleotide-binding protein [Bacteroidetes bacterium QH_8_67_23]|nr:MAG: histidine triad nucleotide-binding protein [Bacteroidetes bacterium QH_8_67_23]
MAERTIFQQIIDGEIPADIVHEDDRCVAFRDNNPQAPVHILVVPREPIPSLDAVSEDDAPLVGHLFGQTVDHLHLHLLGGRSLGWPPG